MALQHWPEWIHVETGHIGAWGNSNLIADTHPIHFHLVNCQIFSRQRFSDQTYPRGTNIPITGMSITNYLGQQIATHEMKMERDKLRTGCKKNGTWSKYPPAKPEDIY